MSQYILESKTEFERLEEQSTYGKYDYRKELADLVIKPGYQVLDAGCGSGVVARFLAETHSQASIVGCDFSKERVIAAQNAAKKILNIRFEVQNLLKLSFSDNSFHEAVCRYVVEHLSVEDQKQALKEVLRCLKPGGHFTVVDFDGILVNLFPQPPFVQEVLALLQKNPVVDWTVGRKIPAFLLEAGFENVQWRIETTECKGQTLEDEIKLLTEKFKTTTSVLTRLLDSQEKALRFNAEYIYAMSQPGSVLFYNKFIVVGTKPHALKVVS